MNLVDALKKFNRKERYWLVREALGHVELCQDFRNALKFALQKTLQEDIPADAYWAIDYHFDWLAGVAAMLAQDCEDITKTRSRIGNFVTGTQQDIDLLVAFGNTLILIECKAGGAWDKNQLTKKNNRYKSLKDLFDDEIGTDSIKISFLVLSPTVNDDLFKLIDPDLRWLELKSYNKKQFSRIERRRLDASKDAPFTHYRVRNA